jgi:hypothetical protein
VARLRFVLGVTFALVVGAGAGAVTVNSSVSRRLTTQKVGQCRTSPVRHVRRHLQARLEPYRPMLKKADH